MCIWRQCNKDPSASLGMTVLGERIGSQGWLRCLFRRWYSRIAAFPMRGRLVWWRLRRLFDWAMPESSILVTSRFYDTRKGTVSHAWYEILRLSPHLFWLRLFSHRAFSSAQDDDTGKRKGFHLGDTLRVLELSVLYTIRVGPWRRAAPKAQDGST